MKLAAEAALAKPSAVRRRADAEAAIEEAAEAAVEVEVAAVEAEAIEGAVVEAEAEAEAVEEMVEEEAPPPPKPPPGNFMGYSSVSRAAFDVGPTPTASEAAWPPPPPEEAAAAAVADAPAADAAASESESESDATETAAAASDSDSEAQPAQTAEEFEARYGGVDPEVYVDPAEQRPLAASSEEVRAVKLAMAAKLSEANQYARYVLKEANAYKEELLENAVMLGSLETEIRNLSELARKAADGGGDGEEPVSLHDLASRSEAVANTVKERLEGTESMVPRKVQVTWEGMANEVRLMGSFDGWTKGELMSQPYQDVDHMVVEYRAELMLRPGRYTLKFLCDNEWKLADTLPKEGWGMEENNVLVVEAGPVEAEEEIEEDENGEPDAGDMNDGYW